MTVSSSTSTASFVANGATVFPLPFRFFDNDDVLVYLVDPVTGAVTQQDIGVDYTLSGAGEPEVDGNPLSTLTLTAPLSLGGPNLYVERVMALEQPTDIVNQGRFFPEVHEDAFDRLTMLIQQANANSKGAIRVAVGDPEPARLVPAAQRAGFLLGFDGLGNPIAVAPVNGSAADLAMRLANNTDPTLGAALVGHESTTVAKHIGDMIVVRSTGSQAGDLAALTAAIATGKEVYLHDGDTFTLDNSAGPGLTISANNVRITGKGRIVATSIANDLIRITGNNAWVEYIELVGTGAYDPTVVNGNPPSLLRMTGQNCVSYKVTYTEPYSCGLLLKQTAGSRALYNKVVCSYAGSIAVPSLFGILTLVTSDTLVKGNTVQGCIQGICGGGDDSAVLTVTGLDGVVSSKVRNTTIAQNFCVNQLDHSIYYSNSSESTTIDSNIVGSVNAMIKIEGGSNTVSKNTGNGGEGIQGRNVFNTVIDGNQFLTTKNSASAYGILLFDTVYQRDSTGIRITNNVLSHGTGATSAGGIYVQGQVFSGFQVQLQDIDISGNRVKGYGSISEGVGIAIDQDVFAGSPVTGDWAENITVANNTITMPTSANPNYACAFFNVRYMAFTGNSLINFRTNGVRELGVANSTFSGNTLVTDPGAAGVFGFFERAKDLTTHFSSLNNRYGNNTYTGSNFSRLVNHSDETCFNSDRVIVRRTGALASDTVIAGLWPKQYVYNNHNAGAVITLDALAATPWPIDSDITISNAAAANSLTVNPGGFAVAAGTSLRLVCTGSNAFIRAN